MIIGIAFPGDNDDELKRLQHDSYMKNLPKLYIKMKRKYINAIKLVGTETEIYKLILDKRSFDHRVLQDSHDLIAAYYRYINPKSNYLKLRFNKNEQENRETYRKMEKLKAWNEYWNYEINDLLNYNYIIRTILEAVAYQNTEKGYKAEDELIRLLYSKYGDSFKDICSIGKYVFEKN